MYRRKYKNSKRINNFNFCYVTLILSCFIFINFKVMEAIVLKNFASNVEILRLHFVGK